MSIEFDATTVQPTGSSVAVAENDQTVPVNETPADAGEGDETTDEETEDEELDD